ncbi:Uncharacterized protein HZ326_10100 [Fusarium oxysporum f. sp. albedinis]|nr:Uncharacterized protein HZ326_10100 [Fusarium oxysporum f. sp. albedinis]
MVCEVGARTNLHVQGLILDKKCARKRYHERKTCSLSINFNFEKITLGLLHTRVCLLSQSSNIMSKSYQPPAYALMQGNVHKIRLTKILAPLALTLFVH